MLIDEIDRQYSISSYKLHRALGNFTLFGFHSCWEDSTICRHVANSSSVGVLVCARMLVPCTINGSTKSQSVHSIYNEELLYGLSCTVTPNCRS